jgi:glycosyltransferase involved in cell wall biosynthesis
VRTAVLVPCYNEAATVGSVVRSFLDADPTCAVYVYDNNSTDDTAALAAEAGAIVAREYRQGKGWVVRSMFRDIDADCYIMVDGDDTYSATQALAMRAFIEDGSADMVIGNRMGDYAKEKTRRYHGFGNALVRTLVNRLFGSSLADIMTGCRCMNRRFVKTLPLASSGFEIETEMTIHALDKGFLLREVPISYRERGEDSQSKLNTISDGAKVLATVFRLFRHFRPLRFFGGAALILVALSLAMFTGPFGEYLRTGFVSKVPTLVVSAALGMGSMLALTCGLILDSSRIQSNHFYETQLMLFNELEALRAGSSTCD